MRLSDLMKAVLLWCIIILSTRAHAQNYVWAETYIHTLNVATVEAITTDDSGNVFVAGSYNYDLTVGPYTLPSTPIFEGFFMAKVSPNGQVIWAQSISDSILIEEYSRLYANINDIKASSNSNNIFYCAGDHIGSISPNGAVNLIISLNATWDSSNAKIEKIALQGNSLYFAGYFWGNLSIGDSTFANGQYGSAFIAKYDLSSNQYVWVKQISQTASVNSISGLIADNSGNAYISGGIGPADDNGYPSYSDASLFGNIPVTCNGFSKGFVAQINAAGNYTWLKHFGITGAYYNSLGIGTDSAQHIYFVAQPNSAGFPSSLFKLNLGGQIIWNKQYEHTNSWFNVGCSEHAIYFTGNDSNVPYDTLNLGSTVLNNSYSNYILSLDTAGNFGWINAYKASSTPSSEINYLAVAKNGMVYTTGKFYHGIQIANSVLINTSIYSDEKYLALLYNHQDSVPGNATVQGRIYNEQTAGCILDSTASAAKYFSVITSPGNYIATTDSNGYYSLNVPAGNYTVTQLLPEMDAGSIALVCPANLQYSTGPLVAGTIDTGNNFINQLNDCSFTSFNINAGRLTCNEPFNVLIQLYNYSGADIDSVNMEIGISDSLSSISFNPSYSYFDSLTSKAVFQNLQLGADTFIAINITATRLCNQAELAGTILNTYLNVVTAQVPGVCSNSLTADSFGVQTNAGLGIKNAEQEINMNVYPNPFQNQIFVQLNDGEEGLFTIYDLTGKEMEAVKTTYSAKTPLDLAFLDSGAYILKYQSATGMASKLIIKQ